MAQQLFRLPFLLLSVGALASTATQAEAREQQTTTTAETSAQEAALLLAQTVQRCDDGRYPKFYARVETSSDPLVVRQAPNRSIVGSIPKGWEVIVYEWSDDGAWARVASHFSQYSGYRPNSRISFASAPDFSSGWVSAAYLKDIGRFCDKPAFLTSLVEPEVFGAQPVEVQADWLVAADSLAEQW